MSRQSASDWFPVLLKYAGLFVAFVFVPAFWAITSLATGTGQIEPLILTAGLTAAGLGEGADALREVGKLRQPPPSTSASQGPPSPAEDATRVP